MRASELLLIALAATACSNRKPEKVADKPAPVTSTAPAAAVPVNSFADCTRYIDKARPVIEEMTKKVGQPFGPGETAAFVKECTESTAAREPLMTCVLGAADEAAVRRCYGQTVP